ncbi:Cleavage/polyadenylation specificity factor A [Penicillium alfredii]|uniref:DNA damage-binding protein 1 n=1 Tax=Penicillium alfredii TaxID=1506179 RepID=A0A9W9FLG9_9EURO|nr:Cleavage/polyadenylation specificity factor A [Penicillium alfredii]KAJ5102357.1 Cleavage/polyadenylation specificity factor A [Penicillium alfredii]
MAYVVPIHRASSIRHAVKLNFMKPEEDCLVAAKASRLEFYTLTPDGLVLAASRALFARVTMLARLPAPANSPTDHLFVGTNQNNYFTLAWDAENNRIRTTRSYVDIADVSSRHAQTAPRCLIDPSGRFMTLEIYEGVIVVVPIVQPSKKRGRNSQAVSVADVPQVGELGDPTTSRIDELFVRSSAFLHSEINPWLALLYEDNQRRVRLRIRELDYSPATPSASADATFREVQDKKLEGGVFAHELDFGSTHLIPIPAPLGGLIVLGETSIKYIDENANDMISRNLDQATVFVAWEKVDSQRWLLADDYGRLFFLMFVLNSQGNVEDWKLDHLGNTSRASVLVYLGGGILFWAIQTLSNIAPILDFTVMDLGNRTSESQTHEFSSGQARIVTGSGAFDDGSLRSVRSGVGMEELGVLGEMDHITDMWGLQTQSTGDTLDTLLVTFVDETRVFRFSPDGEVEELDSFLGLSLSESTLVAANLPGGRILQITEQRVLVADRESGMLTFEWTPPTRKIITAASANDSHLVLVLGGQVIVSFDIQNHVQIITQKELGVDRQISGVTVPSTPAGICIAGFPQSATVSILGIQDFAELQTQALGPRGEAFPRSVLVADVLADSPPTLFVSMANGSVITFSLNPQDYALTDMNTLTLGSEQPAFKKLPRGDGLYNVFATCENPSLIYGSEGRIIYSAVNSEGAARICHLNAEAFPEAIAVATTRELKIALVDKERTTQIQTLPMGASVRRVAYSPSERAFVMGAIDRKLEDGAEIVKSRLVLADEIMFQHLDALELQPEELVESVIRAEFPGEKDENGRDTVQDRFIVGTAHLDEGQNSIRGRILVLEVDHGRKLTQVAELPLKGACRALAMMGDLVVAALVRTVVVYKVINNHFSSMKLEKLAAYRTSTAPIDISIVDDLILVGDMMKSACLVKYSPGKNGEADQLTEVGRHYQTVWSTALAHVGKDTFLQSDAEGNLIVLSRNMSGLTEQDQRRLTATSEFSLGEMVNRIRPVNFPQLSNMIVNPRAFMATVEGSIYLFALINPEHQDFLMTLQTVLASKVDSLGQLPFDKYRAFRTLVRSADAPYRFVDGELIEQFLKCDLSLQEEILGEMGSLDLEEVKRMIEALRRLH